MDSPDLIPALHSTGFVCPHCGVAAHQTWGVLYRRIEEEPGYDESYLAFQDGRNISLAEQVARGGFGIPTAVSDEEIEQRFWRPGDHGDGSGEWREARCARCTRSSVWRDSVMIYPPSGMIPPPHEAMDVAARELYEEGRGVSPVSRRAAAALARAALERQLRALDPETGKLSLEMRIDRVSPDVSLPLRQQLTLVRHAGNKSLHVEDEPDEVMVLVLDPQNAEIGPVIFDAINRLVAELVDHPRRTAELYSKVPKQIRDKVELTHAQKAPESLPGPPPA